MDWRSGAAGGSILFTDSPASVWPEVANGYVGWRPQPEECSLENSSACNPLYVAGVYSGRQFDPSRRAALPRYKVTAALQGPRPRPIRQAWALDMERGVFTERSQIECATSAGAGSVTVEQQYYAHRESRHVLVHNITIMNGCPHAVSFKLDCGWVAKSSGVQMNRSDGIGWSTQFGSTLLSETPEMPRVSVAVRASTCNGETLQLATAQAEERTFLQAVATSLPNDHANGTTALESAVDMLGSATKSAEAGALLVTHEAAWRQLWNTGPPSSKTRALVLATRTLNGKGHSRVTVSLR